MNNDDDDDSGDNDGDNDHSNMRTKLMVAKAMKKIMMTTSYTQGNDEIAITNFLTNTTAMFLLTSIHVSSIS